jgi:hypothetical protein
VAQERALCRQDGRVKLGDNSYVKYDIFIVREAGRPNLKAHTRRRADRGDEKAVTSAAPNKELVNAGLLWRLWRESKRDPDGRLLAVSEHSSSRQTRRRCAAPTADQSDRTLSGRPQDESQGRWIIVRRRASGVSQYACTASSAIFPSKPPAARMCRRKSITVSICISEKRL